MPQEKQRTPQKKVEQLIFRDDLTEVVNRRYLSEYSDIKIGAQSAFKEIEERIINT